VKWIKLLLLGTSEISVANQKMAAKQSAHTVQLAGSVKSNIKLNSSKLGIQLLEVKKLPEQHLQ